MCGRLLADGVFLQPPKHIAIARVWLTSRIRALQGVDYRLTCSGLRGGLFAALRFASLVLA